MRLAVLVLSLLLCSPAWATVNVVRFPSGTPVQVCQPSDSNSNCGGGAWASTAGINWTALQNISSNGNVNWDGLNFLNVGTINGINPSSWLTSTNWAALTTINGTGVNWSGFYPTSNPSGYITNAGINWSAFPNTQGYLNTINWAGLTTANGTGVNWQSYYPTSNPFNYLTGNQTITITHTNDITGSASGTTSISIPNTINWSNGDLIKSVQSGNVNWSSLSGVINSSGVNWTDLTKSSMNTTGINWQGAPGYQAGDVWIATSSGGNWQNVTVIGIYHTENHWEFSYDGTAYTP